MVDAKEEIYAFLQQTSVKGIPRAVKANRSALKALWMISTVVFMALAIWQCVVLFIQYYSYPTSTVLRESVLDQGNNRGAVTDTQPPTISLCNLNPFSGNASEIIHKLGLPSLREFRDEILEMMHCPHCSEDDQKLLNETTEDLLSPHGYFAYIGARNAEQIGHKLDDFIVECNQHPKQGFRSYNSKCHRGNMDHFTNYVYYNCWSLTLDPINENPLAGVSLILHLDNFFRQQFEYLPATNPLGQYYGAALLIHEQHTFPAMTQKAIYLAPGMYTNVRLEIKKRTRLSAPYGDCVTRPPIHNIWSYNAQTCISVCLETSVLSHCECHDLFLLGVVNISTTENVTFCGDISQGQTWLLNKAKCAQTIRDSHFSKCLKNCSSPCDELTFAAHPSTALWPTGPFGDAFYINFIEGRPFESHYSELPYIILDNSFTVDKYILSQTAVSNNFLRVDVSLRDITFVQFTDVSTISESSFISQLGGILNFFAGITLVVAVEILELVFRLIVSKEITTKNNCEEHQMK